MAPYRSFPMPNPRNGSSSPRPAPGPKGSPGPGASPQGKPRLSLFRIQGQSGGNGSPLLLAPVTPGTVPLSSDRTALSLPGRKSWLVSLQAQGRAGSDLDSFTDGLFTLTPTLDGVPDPLRRVGGYFPGGTEGGAVFLSVSFLLPAAEGISLSLLAELSPGGLSRIAGTLSLLPVGEL